MATVSPSSRRPVQICAGATRFLASSLTSTLALMPLLFVLACATPTLLQRAERGDPDAQIELGDSLREAAKAAPQDADSADSESAPDPAEAERWYRLAAEQGDARAEFKLAEIYYAGEGVDVDYVESARWARLAAGRDYAPAAAFMGGLYRLGAGVPRDARESVRWYRAAAEAGDPTSQFFLGAAYDFGFGVQPNAEEAIRWYLLAADQGAVRAQLNLGLLYLQADSGIRDEVSAFVWLRLAAGQGDEKASDSADALLLRLTPEQSSEALERIAEWRRSHGFLIDGEPAESAPAP
jgi:TPR repeat protein